ncbi:hypothetical protein SMWW4_v1c38000 [Serratia marcescens WW4]|nr:hypothetical protein SMWW4_v1c38000 [Serratia marcescens WW4]
MIRCMVFIFSFTAFYASGAVTLNEKWVKKANGASVLSISPTGTVKDKYSAQKNFKCYPSEGAGLTTCTAYWMIEVSGYQSTYCSATVDVNKGTTLDFMASQIDSKLMTACESRDYWLSGGEPVCVWIRTWGNYSDGVTGLTPYFASFGGTCSSAQGGGSSGSVEPPIEPVSCQINNQNIIIQHPALSQENVDGNYKESNFSVSCTRKNSMKLAVSGLDASGRLVLSSAKNLYSKLKINNSPAGSGVTINDVGSDGKNVTISSELQKNGDIPGGNYSASAVLTLEIL